MRPARLALEPPRRRMASSAAVAATKEVEGTLQLKSAVPKKYSDPMSTPLTWLRWWPVTIRSTSNRQIEERSPLGAARIKRPASAHTTSLPIDLNCPAKKSQSLRSMARTAAWLSWRSPSQPSPRRLGTWFVPQGATRARARRPTSSNRGSGRGPVRQRLAPAIPSGVRGSSTSRRRPFRPESTSATSTAALQAPVFDEDDDRAKGLAWLDGDGDGLFDLFLGPGLRHRGAAPSPPPSRAKAVPQRGRRPVPRRDPRALGVALVGCGQGAAVGDIDNDGDPDFFVTFYGRPNVLYRNDGGKRFVEIAASAGLTSPPAGRKGPNWTTSRPPSSTTTRMGFSTS